MDENLNIKTTGNQTDTFCQFEPVVSVPIYNKHGIEIYNGDCRTTMTALRPSVVIADPPYWIRNQRKILVADICMMIAVCRFNTVAIVPFAVNKK